ncbi:S9 family peptidase [Xylanibacter oryzae]|uniref:S9 family peptidase n=1 Tax=Xylanibacter oryzae TaxID=185293 RepID=UPI000563A662|nr:S9 family peptidase [Xylanibacter oryzae]
MKFFSILCTTLLIGSIQMNAGNKITVKQITDNTFKQETLDDVTTLNDGEAYAQISSDGKQIVKYSFKTGKPIGALFDVNTVRGKKIQNVDGYIMSPDGKRILIQTQTKRIYRRSFTAEYYIYDINNNKMVPLSDRGPQQTPLFSPDGNNIAFVRQNNIYLVKLLYDNSESQVTIDGKFNGIINGIPDWVNEEEFSTARSMVFTADSKMICWIRYDESNVKQYSLQLFKGLEPERNEFAEYPGQYSYKYPVPGEANSSVEALSYDIQSHQTRKMKVALDADGYMPRIVMTKDPAKIAVMTFNRHQDDLRIYMANPRSTVSQLVIEDKSDKYVKEEGLENICFTDNHILLPSEKDGFNHLYLYDINGKLIRKIGKGNFVINDVYGYDENNGNVYYSSNENGVTQQDVYVSKSNGSVECLTKRAGWNDAIFSHGFKYFINIYSSMNTPSVYTICNNSGHELVTLIDNKALDNKLKEFDISKCEMFSFTTSEGIKLNGWMIKPSDFDPNKKYPVILYQYSGPGNQQVLNKWGIGAFGQGAIFEESLAQQGFICVCVDGRGTGGRGADFEKCTYLRLGDLESKDQVETALYMGSLPYVDKDRIGIWGWSYGGWNTLMSMSEGRGVFKAGVAVAPPTNWRYYDSVYTERYMRTPKENKSGYDEVNPIARVNNLHGALLICHGLADDNVHFQNTAEYTEALVQADKDFKENIYVNRNHSIYGGNTRNHLLRQITNFFLTEMK